MKTIRNILVVLMSIMSISANAQSFNIEKQVEVDKPQVKMLPNITVLSL